MTGVWARVTDWPQGLLLVVVAVAVAAVAAVALVRGWRRRALRRRDLQPLFTEPTAELQAARTSPDQGASVEPDGQRADAVDRAAEAPTLIGPLPGRYLASTRSGDWLDRLVVHGLGVPSQAHIVVSESGVWWQREGARDVFVPASDLLAVRLERGIAGAVYEEGGVVVVTWALGDVAVDTGFRARQFNRHAAIAEAIQRLVRSPAAAPRSVA